VVFNTRLKMPDEETTANGWFFLRFGDVYVGVRMSAMIAGQRILPQRIAKNNYLRVEAHLLEQREAPVTNEFRRRRNFSPMAASSGNGG
jgi:hypothetical protein